MTSESPKQDVRMRLRRIEGQVRGVEKMVEEGAPCSDILTQVAALTSAIKKVGLVMVQGYLEECMEKAARQKGKKPEDALKDLQKALSRYIDWA